MRTYPKNSPQAAARIVALTLIADGDIGQSELDLLDSQAVHEVLGLSRPQLHQVTDHFCEDLLADNLLQWAQPCPVDDLTVSDLLAEVDDPALRRTVLGICVKLAEVDGQVAEGESVVLVAAVAQWSLHCEMLRLRGSSTPVALAA